MQLNKSMVEAAQRRVRILQFGEGNFLRAFVDWMIDIANEKGVIDTGVAIVKPIEMGSLENFDRQDNLYTVLLRGRENGETVVSKRVVTSVAKTVCPFTQYDEYEELALSEDLRFLVSNTTEAGIAFDPADRYELTPPKTYPGKLTKLLHGRFMKFGGATDKGLVIIPCELNDDNGGMLRDCVAKYIALWNLGADFKNWVENCNIIASTLVDRIVTGFPRDQAEEIWQELGYEDRLLVCGEPFSLWVIESERDFSEELPLDKAGLNVIFTDNVKPYKERKVRILNGAHTSMVLAAYLDGKNYVLECMQDEKILSYMKGIIFDEVIPTLSLPKAELEAFAAAVMERFNNPFIKHELLAIALNSVAKFKARVMPSLVQYYEKFGKIPERLAFSLAALMCFYMGKDDGQGGFVGKRGDNSYKILDDADVLDFFKSYGDGPSAALAEAYLENEKFSVGEAKNIPGLAKKVANYIDAIKNTSVGEVMSGLAD